MGNIHQSSVDVSTLSKQVNFLISKSGFRILLNSVPGGNNDPTANTHNILRQKLILNTKTEEDMGV